MTESAPDNLPRPPAPPDTALTAPATPFAERLRHVLEVLSSMRFAISLLTLICIASIIGTVLRQGEPMNNYVNQFGPFWAHWFNLFGLYNVYSAWWFLLMLAFLVCSTSLCIARHVPKIWREWRTFKLTTRIQSLRAFPQHAQWSSPAPATEAAAQMQTALQHQGWQVRSSTQTEGMLHIHARRGLRRNKVGYLLTHGAIVLICLGGLVDGDMPVSLQAWLYQKTPYNGGGAIADVSKQHWLSMDTLSWRGTLLIPEKQFSDVAVINRSDGLFLQPLPFAVELKKFIVEYYPTGMPKLFASEVVVKDKEDGSVRPARIKVNHPFTYRGYTLYQSDFDDGGSRLKVRAQPLSGAAGFDLDGKVGGSTALTRGANEGYTLEYAGLRTINVENFASDDPSRQAQSTGRTPLWDQVQQRLGSGHSRSDAKFLRNVGPSFSYRLRDSAGQAREFNNYMLPVDMQDGGLPVFLLGVREQVNDAFRYVRLPADENRRLDGILRLRQALKDSQQRRLAAQAFANQVRAGQTGSPALNASLRDSALTLLDLFAGDQAALARQGVDVKTAAGKGGLAAIEAFIVQRVPKNEQAQAAETMVQILRESLVQLYRLQLKPQSPVDAAQQDWQQRFVSLAIFGLSDLLLYPADIIFTLTSFDQVQASVLQVSRAPGRYGVYFGSMLLMLGVFFLLYVRERRVWAWLRPRDNGCDIGLAYSSNRKTLDAEREFEALQAALNRPELDAETMQNTPVTTGTDSGADSATQPATDSSAGSADPPRQT